MELLHCLSSSDSLVFISVKTVGCPGISLSSAIISECSAVLYGGRDICPRLSLAGSYIRSKRFKTVEPESPPEFSLHSSGYLTGLNTHGILGFLLTSVCCSIPFCMLWCVEGFEVVTTVVMKSVLSLLLCIGVLSQSAKTTVTS